MIRQVISSHPLMDMIIHLCAEWIKFILVTAVHGHLSRPAWVSCVIGHFQFTFQQRVTQHNNFWSVSLRVTKSTRNYLGLHVSNKRPFDQVVHKGMTTDMAIFGIGHFQFTNTFFWIHLLDLNFFWVGKFWICAITRPCTNTFWAGVKVVDVIFFGMPWFSSEDLIKIHNGSDMIYPLNWCYGENHFCLKRVPHPFSCCGTAV